MSDTFIGFHKKCYYNTEPLITKATSSGTKTTPTFREEDDLLCLYIYVHPLEQGVILVPDKTLAYYEST